MLVLELNINPKNKHMFHDKYGSKKGTENSTMIKYVYNIPNFQT